MKKEIIELNGKVTTSIYEMKFEEPLYRRFLFHINRTLWSCYKNPSMAKEIAWEYCKNLCDEMNGYSLSVIGYNSSVFSAGFRCKYNNREIMVYITKSQDRFCYIDEKYL